MKAFLDDIREEVKKGKYAAAVILLLMLIITVGGTVLWNRGENSTEKIDLVRQETFKASNDARLEERARCAAEIQGYKDQINDLKQQVADIRQESKEFQDFYIDELRGNKAKSANLVSKSRKVINRVEKQREEVKEVNKVIDAVSKSLTP